MHVLAFSGSLRAGSTNTALLHTAAELAPSGMTIELYTHLGDLPHYNEDVRLAGPPDIVIELKKQVAAADAVLFSTPEYNYAPPGVLKNLIDWVSRFRPQPLNGKHALRLSASPSMVVGNRGLWALRIPFEPLGTRVYPDMFSLAQAHQALTADGNIADEKLRKFFEGTIDCFMELVEAAKHYPELKTQWVEFLGEKPDPATERVETGRAAA